jgi:type II secretory pathway pseudopilin PulG
MPDESKVCPQCAAPVQEAMPPPQAGQPTIPTPASTSAWLNVPAAPVQNTAQPQSQPQNPPQYQPYRGQNPSSGQQTDGKATASLILGILSLLCFSILTGIPAIILGHMSKANIRNSMGRLKGDGMATAGLVMGYLSAAAIPLILIIAAIAIPNLLRAKISANESAAMSTVRTMNTAQTTYQTTYSERGYAPDLATLGSADASCSAGANADHACLLDAILGAARCTSGIWCQKNAYRFTIISNCDASSSSTQEGGACKEYVAAATPVTSATGLHNYCSVSDAIVRVRRGGPLVRPPTAEECGEWPPI